MTFDRDVSNYCLNELSSVFWSVRPFSTKYLEARDLGSENKFHQQIGNFIRQLNLIKFGHRRPMRL